MAGPSNAIRAGRAFVELFADDTKLARDLKRAQARMRRFASVARVIGQRMLGVGAVMATPFAAVVKMASDAEESINRFTAVFGKDAAAAGKFADDLAERINRSGLDIRNGMATFQSFFKGLDFEGGAALELSQDLQTLAQDFASFNNLTDQDALGRFISALSGSSEVLDRFGINTKVAALDQELLAQGIEGGTRKATEQQKVLARLAIIRKAMEQQGAIGDAEKTSGSLANVLKGLQASGKDLAVAVGSAMIGDVAAFATRLRTATQAAVEWIQANAGLVASIGKAISATAALGAGMLGLSVATSVAASALTPMASVARILSKGIGVSARVATRAVLGLSGGFVTLSKSAAVAAVGLLKTVRSMLSITKIVGAAKAAGAAITTALAGAGAVIASPGAAVAAVAAGIGALVVKSTGGLSKLTGAVVGSLRELVDNGKVAWHAITQTATRAYGSIVQRIQKGDMLGALKVGLAGMRLAFTQTINAFSSQWGPWIATIRTTWRRVSAFFAPVFRSAVDKLKSAFSSFLKWFTGAEGSGDLLTAFKDTVTRLAKVWATGWASMKTTALTVINAIKDAYGDFATGVANVWTTTVSKFEKAGAYVGGAVFGDDETTQEQVQSIDVKTKQTVETRLQTNAADQLARKTGTDRQVKDIAAQLEKDLAAIDDAREKFDKESADIEAGQNRSLQAATVKAEAQFDIELKTDELTNAQTQLANLQEQAKSGTDVKVDIDKARQAIVKMERELLSLRIAADSPELVIEHREAAKRVAGLKRELESIGGTASSVELTTKAEELEAAQKKLAELKEQRIDVAVRVQNPDASAELSEIAGRVSELRGEINTMAQEMPEGSIELDAKSHELVMAEARLHELRTTMANARRELESPIDLAAKAMKMKAVISAEYRVFDSQGREIKTLDEAMALPIAGQEGRFDRRRRIAEEKLAVARQSFGELSAANAGTSGTFSGRAAGQLGSVSVTQQIANGIKEVAENTGRGANASESTAEKIDGLMMEAE